METSETFRWRAAAARYSTAELTLAKDSAICSPRQSSTWTDY